MGSLTKILPKHLTTERLTLELFDHSKEHYDCLVAVMNTPSALERMGDYGVRNAQQFDHLVRPARLSPSLIGGAAADIDIYYLARLKETGALIGGVSCSQRTAAIPPEVGWCFLEAVQRQDYATEAARELCRMTREILNIQNLICLPRVGNAPSCRVAEKVGLIRLTREDVPMGGILHVLYGSVTPDFDVEAFINDNRT